MLMTKRQCQRRSGGLRRGKPMPRRSRDLFAQIRTLHEVRHNPLWFGWADQQLEKVSVEMGWREQSDWRVLAAVACSLVAEHQVTGNPLRYSRSQRWYARNADRVASPLMGYRQVVPAMDQLMNLGLADGIKGIWLAAHKGRQSIAWPTSELIQRVTPILDIARRDHPDEDDVLVLRDADGSPLPFPDTELTRSWRRDLKILNTAYEARSWFIRGRQLDMPVMRRIFNQDITRGGRGYHHGPSYQQLSHEERELITIDINGVMWPTVERDAAALHIRFAYAKAGVPMPEYADGDDAYVIDGFHRNREVKPALNTLLNAATEKQALGVIGGSLLGGDWDRGRGLIAALKAKHPALAPLFCSDAGANFQRLDSDMAMSIAMAVLRRTGRPPLLIHDSMIVAACDEQILVEEMEQALAEALTFLSSHSSAQARTLQDRLQSTLPPFLSPLGKHH
ncbi:hypothetical protein M4D79_23250 [Mycolicibacterium novocastrense]|nr:hypothetical protein M4D79_23250 [Mycolicibacterium novocastrense]